MVYTKRALYWHDGHGCTMEYNEGDYVAVYTHYNECFVGSIIEIEDKMFGLKHNMNDDTEVEWFWCEDVDEIREVRGV